MASRHLLAARAQAPIEREVAIGRRHVPALLVAQAAAFWPVWGWAAARVREGDADEIVALLAAAAALLIAPRAVHVASGTPRPSAHHQRHREPSEAISISHWPRLAAAAALRGAEQGPVTWGLWILPTLLTLGYALLIVAGAPPLLRAMAAACALLATWSAWRWDARPHPAGLGLVLLALPALPTAQFMLGFPLRAAAGELAARLLGLSGLAVVREGVSLRMGDRLVAIDAPCSGVNMLWMAVLLALVLAALAGTPTARTAMLVTAASALAIAGNALRAASLFLIETGIAPLPRGLGEGTVHVALGVIAFALAAAPLPWMARRQSAGTSVPSAPAAARLRGAQVHAAEAAAP